MSAFALTDSDLYPPDLILRGVFFSFVSDSVITGFKGTELLSSLRSDYLDLSLIRPAVGLFLLRIVSSLIGVSISKSSSYLVY